MSSGGLATAWRHRAAARITDARAAAVADVGEDRMKRSRSGAAAGGPRRELCRTHRQPGGIPDRAVGRPARADAGSLAAEEIVHETQTAAALVTSLRSWLRTFRRCWSIWRRAPCVEKLDQAVVCSMRTKSLQGARRADRARHSRRLLAPCWWTSMTITCRVSAERDRGPRGRGTGALGQCGWIGSDESPAAAVVRGLARRR